MGINETKENYSIVLNQESLLRRLFFLVSLQGLNKLFKKVELNILCLFFIRFPIFAYL